MKKIIVIVGIIVSFLYSDSITQEFLEYTNKIINYNFDLKHFEEINPPFEPVVRIVNGKEMKNKETLIKTIKIDILSIFNKQAYFLINVYLGDQLIKSYTKWIKEGSKISNCIVKKITLNSVFLQCKNKKLIKTLNKKIPGLRNNND